MTMRATQDWQTGNDGAYGGGTYVRSTQITRPIPTAPIRVATENPLAPPGARPVQYWGNQPPALVASAAPAQLTVAAPVAPPPPAPIAAPPNPNAGTPVPAGYPTNQIFVNSDGSFWQYSANGWVNVGTPYNTGAAATPAAPAPSPSGGSTAAPTGTTAPAPVSITTAPAAVAPSQYQAILDWLQTDTLLSSLGFAGIPNWITGGGVLLLGYKVTQKSGKR
jgi:hypothetical protein